MFQFFNLVFIVLYHYNKNIYQVKFGGKLNKLLQNVGQISGAKVLGTLRKGDAGVISTAGAHRRDLCGLAHGHVVAPGLFVEQFADRVGCLHGEGSAENVGEFGTVSVSPAA